MGQVIFIGAGPGAADLITLRGAQRLATAEVVLFDALTDPALRTFAPQARWIDVGKRGFREATGQAVIDALLVKLAGRHAVVVRLKGGDPSVFGRLEEELEALAAHGIACEVVPGVTAAIAAAAATRRPLTRRGRGRSVSLATAMTREGSCRPANAPTPRSSTWPAASSARSAGACRPPVGRPTRRCAWSRAPAGPTSWPATTRPRPWPPQRCCMPGGRRWSRSAPGLARWPAVRAVCRPRHISGPCLSAVKTRWKPGPLKISA
jgi:hypothetical protein